MEVMNIETLNEKVKKAIVLLYEVSKAIETKSIVQTVSQPEPPKAKKAGKKRGRKPGQKNKTVTTETPPPDTYMGNS